MTHVRVLWVGGCLEVLRRALTPSTPPSVSLPPSRCHQATPLGVTLSSLFHTTAHAPGKAVLHSCRPNLKDARIVAACISDRDFCRDKHPVLERGILRPRTCDFARTLMTRMQFTI